MAKKAEFKLRAHDTFFIRKGWLYKGLKNIKIKRDVFTDRESRPTDTLGIGSNMVKALRYWLQAVGLTVENKSGKRYQEPTELGKVIWENDKYIEELGTLWLLHYKLVTSKKLATSWYYFFNTFNLKEFDKEDFVLFLNTFLVKEYKIEVQPKEEILKNRSYNDDFDCIVRTYIPRNKLSSKPVHPEDVLDCPLGELGLIDFANKKNRVFRKTQPKKESLHPLIVLSVLIDNAQETNEIKISKLLTDTNNVGKVFNLDMILVTDYLYKLQQMGYLRVIRTAGLDVIRLTTELSFLDCVNEYYQSINNI